MKSTCVNAFRDEKSRNAIHAASVFFFFSIWCGRTAGVLIWMDWFTKRWRAREWVMLRDCRASFAAVSPCLGNYKDGRARGTTHRNTDPLTWFVASAWIHRRLSPLENMEGIAEPGESTSARPNPNNIFHSLYISCYWHNPDVRVRIRLNRGSRPRSPS